MTFMFCRYYFLITIIGLLLCSCANKVKYNVLVKDEYYKHFKKFSLEFRKDDEMARNLGLVNIKEDTLNKEDIIKAYKDIIVSPPDGEKEYVPGDAYNKPDEYIPLMSGSYTVKGKSLIINIVGLLGMMRVTHEIKGDDVTTSYKQLDMDEEGLKASLEGPTQDSVSLKVKTISFELNTKNVNANELYGYADIVTAPFYVVNNFYKDGYLKKRLHLKYFFKMSRP